MKNTTISLLLGLLVSTVFLISCGKNEDNSFILSCEGETKWVGNVMGKDTTGITPEKLTFKFVNGQLPDYQCQPFSKEYITCVKKVDEINESFLETLYFERLTGFGKSQSTKLDKLSNSTVSKQFIGNCKKETNKF